MFFWLLLISYSQLDIYLLSQLVYANNFKCAVSEAVSLVSTIYASLHHCLLLTTKTVKSVLCIPSFPQAASSLCPSHACSNTETSLSMRFIIITFIWSIVWDMCVCVVCVFMCPCVHVHACMCVLCKLCFYVCMYVCICM